VFKLYYPDGSGNYNLVGQFASQQACIDQAVLDGQENYTIEKWVGSDIVMVVSC